MHGRFKALPRDFDLPPAVPEGEREGIDLWRLWAVLLRRWWAICTTAAAIVLLAGVWLLQASPLYTATTQVLLDPRKQKTLPGEAFVSEIELNSGTIATEIALITSFAVGRRVVDRLDLAHDPEFGGAEPSPGFFGGLMRMAGLRPAPASKPAATAPAGPTKASDAAAKPSGKTPAGPTKSSDAAADEKELELVDAIQHGASVRREGLTYFIDISFTHSDPNTAATIANALADAYLVEQLEARYQTAKRAADWLSGRVAEIRTNLEAAEQAVADHRAKNKLVGATEGSISDQQAADINGKLVVARAEAVEKRTRYEQASKLVGGDGKIESVPAVMQSPLIVGLRQRDTDTARQEADVLTRYGPEHPEVVKIRAERRDIKRAIAAEIERIVANLESDWQLSLSKERSLEASLAELTNRGSRNDEPMIRLRELERNAAANKALYEALLARLKEAEQQQSLQTADSRVVAPAFAPDSPSFPNRTRTMVLALILGLGFGAAFAALLEYLETGFVTVEQVEKALSLPVVAMVPQMGKARRKANGQTLSLAQAVVSKPMSQFSESIRSARVSAEMSSIDDPPKVILVASSIPAEGKTMVAIALAVSAASAGKRVLLIDCDLRHPSCTGYFNLGKAPGLTDLLSNKALPEAAIYKSSVPLLTVIPAGASTAHPPDVLGSERMKQFLQGMKDAYDLVVVDTSPLIPVIDGALLSRIVDKVLFVVSWRSTARAIVQRAIASLHEPRLNVAGIVLNRAELRHMARYTQYYRYYNKGYQQFYVE